MYIKRSEGRGIISVEDCVLTEPSVSYVHTNPEIKEAERKEISEAGKDNKTIKESRESNLKSKSLHSIFFSKDTQGETKGTRGIRHGIDRENIPPLCRLCGEREETTARLVSEYKHLAQKQYQCWGRDGMPQVLQREKLCQKHKLKHAKKKMGMSTDLL